MNSVEVRKELTRAMRLDLVGPDEQLGAIDEVLPQAPARWYLTGFIVPLDAEASQRVDEDGSDEVDQAPESAGVDDATPPEPTSARQRYLPSSIGLSVLISEATRKLRIKVRWGDYKRRKAADGHGSGEEWERQQRQEEMTLDIPPVTKSATSRV